MSISLLRERVLIQARAYVPDQVGGYTISWADRGQLWADIKPLATSSEQVNEVIGPQPNRYRIRWRYGTKISSLARLKWQELYLRFVTRPQPDVYRRWVTAIVQVEEKNQNE